MKLQLKKSETSVILIVFIQNSSLTTGAGLGSLDQTSGITGGYVKRGGTGVALAVDEDVTTEGTYQAPSTAAHVRIGTPANMPTGFYELHFHNNLFTTADYVTIGLGGASNMAPLNIEIQLTSIDLNDAVRAGITALPNANADAAGGLPISDAGGLDLDTKLANTNEVTAVRMGALTDWINGGRLDVILDTIAADVENIDGDAMRGTDNANTTVPDAAGTAAALHSVTDALLNTIAGYLDTEIAAILEDTGTTIPALIAALNNISAAQVNAEIVDALSVDTYAEPGQGAPGATVSLAYKIGLLYKALRNKKTQTTTEFSLYADDATTVDHKTADSDDGTTTVKGEMTTGA